ncbi:MAG: SCP2 sterol-binding domain-containing protein [Actinobacteria bacterium]|jgi:putative sterol carrier protein|nr:SCP2 sterol-binding domain-containing protein [Actinomycetota bacterium]
MSKWLTQEWLDETLRMAESQPERLGVDATLQYVVTGGENGTIEYYWVLKDGKIVESKLGKLDGAEITLTMGYADAIKVQKGELDANAAFMQGKVKIDGNMGKMMSLLPITNSAEYKQLQKDILGITEF